MVVDNILRVISFCAITLRLSPRFVHWVGSLSPRSPILVLNGHDFLLTHSTMIFTNILSVSVFCLKSLLIKGQLSRDILKTNWHGRRGHFLTGGELVLNFFFENVTMEQLQWCLIRTWQGCHAPYLVIN